MSTPIGKPGDPGYIGNSEVPKKGQNDTPTSPLESKVTDAFRGQKGVGTRDSKEGHNVNANAEEKGGASFKGVPRGVVQRILGFVPSKKDLQATRLVETFMNQEVVAHVKGFDLPQIRILTDFLIDKLPDHGDSLQMPKELIEGLESSNLETYTEALYLARSHLIDELAKIEPQKITEIEKAFHDNKLQLPTKFKNLFELARVHNNKDDNSKIERANELHEGYESLRICAKSKSEENRIDRVEEGFSTAIDLCLSHVSPKKRLNLPDIATFQLIEREYSRESTKENNRVLYVLYLTQVIQRIMNGLFDKGIDSFLKAVAKKPSEVEEVDELALIAWAVAKSEIDPKSAEGLFKICEHECSARTDSNDVDKARLLQIYSQKIKAYAERGFVELQVAMNRAIKLLDSGECEQGCVEGLTRQLSSLRLVPDAEKEKVLMCIVNAIVATESSGTKIEILGGLFLDRLLECLQTGDPKFEDVQKDVSLFLQAVERLPKASEKLLVVNYFVKGFIGLVPQENKNEESKLIPLLLTSVAAAKDSDSKHAIFTMFWLIVMTGASETGALTSGDKKNLLKRLEYIKNPEFKDEVRRNLG
ncbi:MAG: hypothetical protein JSS12_09150, partial [Verrucomicrobia bacterium]|nr:hypothetical protein [Verrucomicrobiota bacterium]